MSDTPEKPSEDDPHQDAPARQDAARDREAPLWLLIASAVALVLAIIFLTVQFTWQPRPTASVTSVMQGRLLQFEAGLIQFHHDYGVQPWGDDEPNMDALLRELAPIRPVRETLGTPRINKQGRQYVELPAALNRTDGGMEVLDPWGRPMRLWQRPDGAVVLYSVGPDGIDQTRDGAAGGDDVRHLLPPLDEETESPSA